ncbi:tectonic-3-like [Periplaneta americana]|uniref:tectonic-3-like n=1 Tax=Periplaneta americana TaxID=6978 RepID=UPI0037E8DC20
MHVSVLWVLVACVCICTYADTVCNVTNDTCSSGWDNDNSTSDENVTQSYSTENATEVTSVTSENEATSVKPETVSTVQEGTTTEPVPTTSEIVVEARPISTEICTCDLTLYSCDINCCCDVECSESDRLVFSGCHKRTPSNVDSRYCYQTHFVYHNNTELKIVHDAGGLLCIEQDNLSTRHTYYNRKVVTSLQEFEKLYKRQRPFPWPMLNIAYPVFDAPAKPYQAGDVMWAIVNRKVVPLGLPIKISGVLCQTSTPVKYLSDWHGSCSRVGITNAESCENNPGLRISTFYKGFTVLAVPQLANETFNGYLKEECPPDVCVTVSPKLCTELSDCFEVQDDLDPVYSTASGHCMNVLKHLHYVVQHNGTNGVLKISAHVVLVNVSAHSQLMQTFSVAFHWVSDGAKPFHRSGNPGYIVGMPVMSGRKVVQLEEEVTREAIELNDDPRHWLSIASAAEDGSCASKQAVTFGEDRYASCSVPVYPSNFTSPSACSAMHHYVLQLLTGIAMENVTTAKKFNLYVATFGDSRVEDAGDWVHVMLEAVPSPILSAGGHTDWTLVCQSMVTGLQMYVMFAHVGSLALPQAKILGVVFRFAPPRDIAYMCSTLQCAHDSEEQHFELISSVSFIDVTKPAVTEFAEPPVYEVKLVHDFFYPFFSSAFLPQLNHMVVVTVVICAYVSQHLY